MSNKKLHGGRDKIDAIDDQLLDLFNQRAKLVVDLGAIKVKMGKKLFDPTREADIFARLTGQNIGPLSNEAVIRLFERIIDESRSIERTEAYDKADE